jgi:hypothetical protein
MKTVLLNSNMTPKQRNVASYEVMVQLEDDEAFKVVEEMTPEQLQNQMQSALNLLQTNREIRIKIDSVKLDYERNLIVIEQIFEPQPDDDDDQGD